MEGKGELSDWKDRKRKGNGCVRHDKEKVSEGVN